MAVENQRMNKGVTALVDNWEEWSIALKAGDKTSQDWAKAAAGCTKAVADLVGASEELELPTEFFESEKNLALIEEASKGSEKAINELGFAVAAAQIQMVEFNSTMTDINGNAVKLDQFEKWKTTLINGIDTVQNKLDSLSVGQDIGAELGTDWVGALNEMAIATEMSVDEMNSLLNSMGVQAEVTTKEVP
jgi:hypothetical protein